MSELHQSPELATELPPTRRGFYLVFINAVMGIISAALAVPAAIYLLFPPKVRKESEWVETADLASLPVGTPTEISFQRKREDGWKINTEKATAWVLKRADAQVVAYVPQCTHLGCAYHWDDPSRTFVCPCHTSVFSIDGAVLSGPAPRPLDHFQVKVEGGKLQIGPQERHA
jgi:menaquinol-cytochrome c reductase iron-sulfur subunit